METHDSNVYPTIVRGCFARFSESVLRFGRSKCHFLALENGHFCCDLFSNQIFLTGTPGHYTATISGLSDSHAGGNTACRLFMYLNDQRVDESIFVSGNENGQTVDSYEYDQGSRTLVSHTKLLVS